MENKTQASRVLEALKYHPEGLRPCKIGRIIGVKDVGQVLRILSLQGRLEKFISEDGYPLYRATPSTATK